MHDGYDHIICVVISHVDIAAGTCRVHTRGIIRWGAAPPASARWRATAHMPFCTGTSAATAGQTVGLNTFNGPLCACARPRAKATARSVKTDAARRAQGGQCLGSSPGCSPAPRTSASAAARIVCHVKGGTSMGRGGPCFFSRRWERQKLARGMRVCVHMRGRVGRRVACGDASRHR